MSDEIAQGANLSDLTMALDRLDKVAATAVGQIERAAQAVTRSGAVGLVDYRAEKIISDALGVILRVEQDRAKLLGLYAPQQLSVESTDYGKEAEELRNLLTQ